MNHVHSNCPCSAKQKETHLQTERKENGGTTSAIKKRSPNPPGQELHLSFLSEQVSLQHIAPFEMKDKIKRPWRVVMDKGISPSLVNDNTLLNLPLCS